MEKAIAFVKWLDKMDIRQHGNVWRRITNNPKDWPENFTMVNDKELWDKFKEDERKT